MKEITVIARAKAKPGKEKELEAALRACVTPTHAEAGCLKYALHKAVDDPQSLMLVERWTSAQALQEHLATPHVQELFGKVPALADGLPEIISYESVSAGRPDKGVI